MSIHQLSKPCWELVPPLPGDGDRHPHYPTEADAKEEIRRAKDNGEDFDPATKPRQLEACCWLIQCDGECEQIIDEMDEGYISHCESPALAEEVVAAWHWRTLGDLVFCKEDAPEDGQLPPPSPAEQEAAGQMRLWVA